MFNKHSLAIRLPIALIICSLLVGVVAVHRYYQSTYEQEVERAQLAVQQVYQTVASAASIAAYLNDTDLAREVANGLLVHDSIKGAHIENLQTVLAENGEMNNSNNLVFILSNPFFDNEQIGQVKLTLNTSFIQRQARSTAFDSAGLLVFQTGIVLMLFTVITYYVVSKPMAKLSAQLHDITPGDKQRLKAPFGHSKSELGKITESTNKMLDKTEFLIDQERHLRSEVEYLEQRLRLLFEHAMAAMILAKRSGEIVLYNNSTQRLLERLGHQHIDDLYQLVEQAFVEPKAAISTIRQALDNDELALGDYQLVAKDTESVVWTHILVTRSYHEDDETYLQIFIHDITEHRNKLEKLNQKATTDALTGLLNRQGGEAQITARLSDAKAITLMLIDLDGFKPINDVYGHDAGDVILNYVAQQMRACVRKQDLCIRWGGDEFIVVVDALPKERAKIIGEELITAISTPTQLPTGQEVNVSASVGVITSQQGEDLHDLLIGADKAMYHVKNHGKHGLAFADEINNL